MQKWLSNYRVLLFILISWSATCAANEQSLLQRADSLYEKRKFTDAQEIYLNLYNQGYSSHATLLKMAFVYEGLGQTTEALFYLTEYFNETEDAKAYEKIQVLANAKNLSGYELTDFNRLVIWLNNRTFYLIILLLAGCLLSVGLMLICIKRSLINGKLAAGFASLFFLVIFFYYINFIDYPNEAVVARQTYLMDGPSPAADLIGMLPDGNKADILGKQDVWMKVRWNGKEGFVKESDLLFHKK